MGKMEFRPSSRIISVSACAVGWTWAQRTLWQSPTNPRGRLEGRGRLENGTENTVKITTVVGVEEPTPAPGLHQRRVQRVDGVMEHLGECGCARSELLVDRHAEHSRGNSAVKGGYEDVNDRIVQQDKSQYGPNYAAGPPLEVTLHTYHSVVALRHLVVHDEVHSTYTILAVLPDEARSERSSNEAHGADPKGATSARYSTTLGAQTLFKLLQREAKRGFRFSLKGSACSIGASEKGSDMSPGNKRSRDPNRCFPDPPTGVPGVRQISASRKEKKLDGAHWMTYSILGSNRKESWPTEKDHVSLLGN
ncbi:hypothetical protein B0H11DRAFT_2200640 [Mycena galericulata]|nr:hypothetical protein B0H11DRAFT_2200640 [Mycena galericulata]